MLGRTVMAKRILQMTRPTTSNPYEPSRVAVGGPTSGRAASPWWWTAVTGAIWSLAAAFPITAIMALLFRFPVPFQGIDGGLDHVLPSLLGLCFYGALGGFPALAMGGAIAGVAASMISPDAVGRRRLQRILSVGVAALMLFVLATLDWYIGPW